MALDLVVSGATGRMGRALGRLIRDADDLRALGGIARDASPRAQEHHYPDIVAVADAGEMIRRSDATLDFSAPDQLATLIEQHAHDLAGRALLVGTTGLDPATEERLDRLASSAAVLTAANFSVGVNLMLALAERAAAALSTDAYDIEIVEAHHAGKIDAPSGTALALADAVARARRLSLDDVRRDGRAESAGPRPRGEIGIHSLRGGGVAGEHSVHFLGPLERFALVHQAESRDLFAAGALTAARWLVGRGAGRYGMRDVLGF